jgi:hypothetical protein
MEMKFRVLTLFIMMSIGQLRVLPAAALPVPCDGCTMSLDGQFLEPVWSLSSYSPITNCTYVSGCGSVAAAAFGSYKLAWDSSNLWIAVSVSDTSASFLANTAAPWDGSGVEIFFDLHNAKAGFSNPNYTDAHTYQWCITYNSNAILQYRNPAGVTIAASSVVHAGGYDMEIQIPWTNLGLAGPPAAATTSGFDIAFDVYNQTTFNPANPTGNYRDHQVAAFNAQVNEFDELPVNWGDIQYSACLTPTNTSTPLPSGTDTPTSGPSPTLTRTVTPTATPGSPVATATTSVSLQIFDASSVLMQQVTGLSSDHLISSAILSPASFDPSQKPISIISGDWHAAYDGKDRQGNFLPDGAYLMDVESSQGASSVSVKLPFTVLAQTQTISAVLAPNPVLPGANFVILNWVASQSADIQIYDSTGGLVRNFEGQQRAPLRWDLKTASGHSVAAGVYFLVIRAFGQRDVKVLKLAILR